MFSIADFEVLELSEAHVFIHRELYERAADLIREYIIQDRPNQKRVDWLLNEFAPQHGLEMGGRGFSYSSATGELETNGTKFITVPYKILRGPDHEP